LLFLAELVVWIRALSAFSPIRHLEADMLEGVDMAFFGGNYGTIARN
jgi:hypothetical protein